MLKRTTELVIKILNNNKTEILKARDEIKEIVVPINKNIEYSNDLYMCDKWIKDIEEEIEKLQTKLQIIEEEQKINGKK